MADLDNKLVTFASLKETVTRMKAYANQFEPRKEVVSKAKLTYSTNYIRAYCDYVATIPATVRITDDDGSVLLVTGSDSGSWRAVRLIKGETDRFHKVYYNSGYVYIQVDNDSMYTVFGGSSVKVFGSATGTEITIENAADTDIEIPTSYPANAIEYVNETVGSATVDDALNAVIAELHTHDNKEVLDLLSESDTGKLQYNGVTIGGAGGASTADAVEYINDAVGSTNVEEALNKLISDYYYVKPSINSFTATPNGGIFEVGHVVSAPITFKWNYNKDIVSQTLTGCTLADNTVRTATYDSDITSNKTFTLSANDGKNNVSKSISYTFVSPYYTGVSTTDTLTETEITALTKKVETKGSKTINYTTSQSYMVFAYPSSYGAIKSIIDQNGFNVTDSFVRNTVTVNSVEYYVFCSNKCSGSYTIKFNY